MAELDPIAASRAVLIEVANVLGEFREHLVVIGGWVPELLYPNRGHIGSLDVDFAVEIAATSPDVYNTLLQRMTDAGYTHHIRPTRFTKVIEGISQPVKVDFISGEYQTGTKTKSVQVNELQISSLRGTDLAFLAFDELTLTGRMPNGAENMVHVRVVRPEAFILIKAIALAQRTKDKDAYDIAFVLENFQPNLAVLAERMQSLLTNGLAQEAMQFLREKFATIDSVGPVWAADVANGQGRDYEQARRAAYENVQELLRFVGLPPTK